MIKLGKSRELAFRLTPGLSFSDLNLRWDDNGQILFEWSAIERLCEGSGIDVNLFKLTDPSNVASLINHWYEVHRANGGAIDLVKEEAMTYHVNYSWTPETLTLPPLPVPPKRSQAEKKRLN